MNDRGVTGMAGRLLDSIGQVTADEFYRHDTHYNQDSRLGRELLYLIANDDWIRSTTEVINLSRGDAVDTVVKVNVDTGKVTHEAFAGGTGPLWLPLLVLTMPDGAGPAQAASPGQLTVINENGALLSPMREADVWHAISAALAEIFITTADTRWPWRAERRPGADRDQRVLLSAALFRMLSGTRRADDYDSRGRARQEESASPLGEAKRRLRILLRRYFKAYERPAQAGPAMAADSEAMLLVNRAAELLSAFTQAVVVVVGVGRSDAPAVLTLTAPTRKLHDEPRPVHRVLRQLQPRARLEIDLLLPSGDADRQVEIAVPDGVSIDTAARRSPAATPGLDADIVVTVDPPPSAARLATLMASVLSEPVRSVRECLAGLALTQADTLGEVLNHHLVLAARPAEPGGDPPRPTEPYAQLHERTARVTGQLHRLREQLRAVASAEATDTRALRQTWEDGGWLHRALVRRASVSVPGPDTLTGRTGLIENTRQRVPPDSAKVTVPVEVADARFYSIARFSGAVSMVLMAVVLFFYVFALAHRFRDGTPSPEVLTTVLTLFSVIQAGRVEAPDRSTLRGRLTGAGNWLIIASTLPTVVLAIAIAFGLSGWAPVTWSVAAMASQALFLAAMWRGPLSASGGLRDQPYRVLRTSPTPAYGKTGLLRAVWWQTATANALLLGRQAHGYLVWERHPEPEPTGCLSVRPVLGLLQPEVPAGVPTANILAMLRSGTTRESVTFVVLRERPAGLPGRGAVTVPLRIDPDRLTPSESPAEYVDVLVGVAGSEDFPALADHPVFAVLRAAKDRWLQVIETQLPVAPPAVAAPPGTLWARVRIGFRTPEYGLIADFLRDIAAIRHPVWVRAWPEHVPRPLRSGPASAPYGTRRELMTARDFDVVSAATRRGEDPDARTWRMLGICVNSAFGLEHDVLCALAGHEPGLRLAAISHAELHGMHMFVIIGHVPGGRPAEGDLERALIDGAMAPTLSVVLDEWRTARELGFAEAGPLLRVDVRTRDRPGTLGVVLDSLHRALRRRLPSLPESDTSDWRVVLQTGAGRTALARLTLGLPIPAKQVRDWPPARWAEVARDASASAAETSAAGTSTADLAAGTAADRVPEDMVMTVRPVKRERPLPSRLP